MSMQKIPSARPDWLRKKIRLSRLGAIESLIERGGLHTVCREAACPNIGECYSKKLATFMILGNRCTRQCTFCNVTKEIPLPPDPDEPQHLADAVAEMGLRHVVITAPTRDDLPDGGAEHFAKTVAAVKALDPSIVVELLIPDMRGDEAALAVVAASGAEIIGHNLETVQRLYHIRKGAKYERSLRVLQTIAELNPKVQTKSGIMLGLGEGIEEVLAVMQDLLDVQCRLLSIGQYLSPSLAHQSVVEFVDPCRFDFFRERGKAMGFQYIKSSPYARSSYMADEYLKEA
jgi:lipoic acid synthetase